MKIGILGHGVVGGAMAHWFTENTAHEVSVRDPGKGFNDDIFDSEIFMVCIPVNNTPKKNQDLSDLKDIVRDFARASNGKGWIFIRSTVLPGTCDYLSRLFKARVIAFPEFLTQKKAIEDEQLLPFIIGGAKDSKEWAYRSEKDYYTFISDLFPNKEVSVMRNEEAELAKYAHNSFAALKVNFFNAVCNFCEEKGLDYWQTRKGFLGSTLISPDHTSVPGPDGKYGYGGACLTKDTIAFARYLADNGMMGSDILFRTDADNARHRVRRASRQTK